MQVRKRDTQRIYALKTIRKAHIASRPGEITHILAERTVLALVNSPFIVPLKFSFQSPDKLYLVMSFGAIQSTISLSPSSDTLLSEWRRIVLSSTTGGEVRRKPKSLLRRRASLCFGTSPWIQCRVSVCVITRSVCPSDEKYMRTDSLTWFAHAVI